MREMCLCVCPAYVLNVVTESYRVRGGIIYCESMSGIRQVHPVKWLYVCVDVCVLCLCVCVREREAESMRVCLLPLLTARHSFRVLASQISVVINLNCRLFLVPRSQINPFMPKIPHTSNFINTSTCTLPFSLFLSLLHVNIHRRYTNARSR